MENFQVQYKELLKEGKVLKPSYKKFGSDYGFPVLKDGLVYKPLESNFQVRLILEFAELGLKNLVKIRGLYNGNQGYVYEYDEPLLKVKLGEMIKLEQRLKWIYDLIVTHEEFLKRGYLYYDYHSENVIGSDDIKLLDIDGAKDINSVNPTKRHADSYLLELLFSIFVNYDFTLQGDNSNLYVLFRFFLGQVNLIPESDLNFLEIFEKMTQKSAGEIDEFREEIIRI